MHELILFSIYMQLLELLNIYKMNNLNYHFKYLSFNFLCVYLDSFYYFVDEVMQDQR